MDDERFCTKCGENVTDAPVDTDGGYKTVTDDPGYANGAGYGAAQYQQQPQYQQPQYGQQQQYNYAPQPAQQEPEMSVGSWVGTIIVTTFFGIISIILLFVWGFGSSGPESRRRYCKAMLIVDLISIIVGVVMILVFSAVLVGFVHEFSSQIVQFFRDIGIDVQMAATSIGNLFMM